MTIIAAAAVLAGGCSKFLDVHPKGEKINMFETAEEYEDALYGVYNELTGSNLYGQNFYLLPEVLSQNFTTTDYKYSELAEGEMTTQGASATKREIRLCRHQPHQQHHRACRGRHRHLQAFRPLPR